MRTAQADLSLRWEHSHFVGFVMSLLNYDYCLTFLVIILWIIFRLWYEYLFSLSLAVRVLKVGIKHGEMKTLELYMWFFAFLTTSNTC